jgi:hypothetical protein
MWSYLQIEKQRDVMEYGRNRLETVHAISTAGAAGGVIIESHTDVSLACTFGSLSLVDVNCNKDNTYINKEIKRPNASFRCIGWGMPHFEKKKWTEN